MTHHYMGHPAPWFSLLAGMALVAALVSYSLLALWTNRRFKTWPLERYVFWWLGIAAVAAALVGPIAERSHISFQAHMLGHLLLGMLGPLLLLYGKPMTLLMRSLPRNEARALSKVLHGGYFRFIGHPATAALLNIGGLFVLYRTDMFIWMHQSTIVYALVHAHILFAGYLFTMSVLYVDITPHRHSYFFRALVLIVAFAGHKVLAKSLYGSAPAGVNTGDAEAGAMLMYYGGDIIDLVIIILLCYGWYQATAPGRIMRSI